MDMSGSPTSGSELPPRDRPRDSIFLGATIWFAPGGPKHAVRVRNISSGGMMIDFPQSRPQGSSVWAEIKNVGEVAGCVAWSTGNRLGIRFANEIDPDAARVKPAVSTTPEYKRPFVPDRRPGLAIR
jgi:PilZ domain